MSCYVREKMGFVFFTCGNVPIFSCSVKSTYSVVGRAIAMDSTAFGQSAFFPMIKNSLGFLSLIQISAIYFASCVNLVNHTMSHKKF